MSSDLQWMVIRNCSSHLVKKRNIKKYFSRLDLLHRSVVSAVRSGFVVFPAMLGGGCSFVEDPMNMKNIHSPRFSGVIHKKALTIEPHSAKPGVVLVYKKRKFQKKPAKNIARVPLTKGARRTMTSIKRFVNSNKYRKDLKMVALRRASAILKSQRPVVPKKKTFRKKTE